MTAGGERSPLERLRSLASLPEVNAANIIVASALTIWTELTLGVANVLRALFDFLIIPIAAMAQGVGRAITSVFAGMARVVNASAVASELGFQLPIFQNLGPFNLLVGIGVFLLALLMIATFLGFPVTSNLVPGTFTDFEFGPLRFGVEEDEEG